MQRREFLAGLAMALKRDRLAAATALIEKQTASGEVAAAALTVRQDDFEMSRSFGKAQTPDTVFPLASITKPMTAAGILILRDRGALVLSDPVRKFIPEFHGGERDSITIRHLLTHTSGLPDMLPENLELRKRHAPLKDFVAATCRTPLLFPPGSAVKYQSMGILLLSEIAERIDKRPFREFLKSELFDPLGMKQTSLGLGGRTIASTAQTQVTGNDDWNGNSPYWRGLGVPWGGALSTTRDVTRFLRFFLAPDVPIFKPATAAEMISNQNTGLSEPWGLGWMLKPGTFGKRCSTRTFGHYGSSGTVAWADPASRISCVLLTTRPASDSRAGLLGPVSDIVSDSAVL